MATDRAARPLMVQGTTSNAGKSLITAGLCRIFKQDGLCVAPFKSQNMALNSFITADGLEMGRAQVVQAECAGKVPDIRMNPILLKPTSDVGSQVVLNGRTLGNMTAREYYAKKTELMRPVMEAYRSLAAENDVVVIEGAGSPAEINLREHDLVNMGLAEKIDAPVLLVGDIDRGGVFASLAGTLLLLTESERARVKGVIINKFRGDRSVLQPGLDMLEEIIRKPVFGVVSYLDVDIEDEDSLSDRLRGRRADLIDICVVRLPHISNFSDFNPFQVIEGVSVRYVARTHELGCPDLVILPGTKNTIGDLLWLRRNGLEAAVQKLAARGTPVFGVCGGYQMLGETLRDPLGLEQGGEVPGMGLLPGDTLFEPEKIQLQTAGVFGAVGGIFEGLSGLPFAGYEIHMGHTAGGTPLVKLAGSRDDGAQRGNVYGSYVHGIFDDAAVASAIVEALAKKKGVAPEQLASGDFAAHKERQYDLLAEGLRNSLDMGRIYGILEVTGISPGIYQA